MSTPRGPFRNLSEFEDSTFDLLVVGGGIVGAGVTRDSALRGLRVTLHDQSDDALSSAKRRAEELFGKRLKGPGDAAAASERMQIDPAGSEAADER